MYPMIWWWVAGAAITAIVTAIATDDSSSSSSDDDDERRRREENERAEREAREKAKRDREAKEIEQEAFNLKVNKNLAIAFLNEHYGNNVKHRTFLDRINQQNSPYLVKSEFSKIVKEHPCDEVASMEQKLNIKKMSLTQLDTAIADLNKIKESL